MLQPRTEADIIELLAYAEAGRVPPPAVRYEAAKHLSEITGRTIDDIVDDIHQTKRALTA